MHDVLKIIVILLLAYIALNAFVYFKQASIIYYPDLMGRDLTSTPADIGLGYENIEFDTSDRIKLHGWFIPHPDPMGTLLFFHGNAGNISHRLDSIAVFQQLRLNVFIFDYRGYGKSEGRPTEKGTYSDALAAWHFLTETKNFRPEEIIIFGRSLGGSVAAWLASQQTSAGLVVESSFTSVPNMGKQLYPFLPIDWLAHYKYDTQAYVSKTACPVLIAHSPEDDIIPFSEGEKLYASANQPKQFYSMRGDHNNGFIISGDHYIEALASFVDSSLRSTLK